MCLKDTLLYSKVCLFSPLLILAWKVLPLGSISWCPKASLMCSPRTLPSPHHCSLFPSFVNSFFSPSTDYQLQRTQGLLHSYNLSTWHGGQTQETYNKCLNIEWMVSGGGRRWCFHGGKAREENLPWQRTRDTSSRELQGCKLLSCRWVRRQAQSQRRPNKSPKLSMVSCGVKRGIWAQAILGDIWDSHLVPVDSSDAFSVARKILSCV